MIYKKDCLRSMETVFLFGICSRQRREGFQPWDLFPTTSGRFPASGFAPDNVGKVSSLGICSRQRREGFQLRDLFPTTSGRFPASGFVPDNVGKVSSFGICSRQRQESFQLRDLLPTMAEKITSCLPRVPKQKDVD